MQENYYVIVDGYELPKWVFVKPEDRTYRDWQKRAMWEEVCHNFAEMVRHTEEWDEKIRHPVAKNEWKHTEGVYFRKYVSDDLIYLKCTIPGFDLDDEKKCLLPGMTNRQVIDNLYFLAYDTFYSYTQAQLIDYINELLFKENI